MGQCENWNIKAKDMYLNIYLNKGHVFDIYYVFKGCPLTVI